MADPEHIKWLREGVDSWNQRLGKTRIAPDLSYSNITELLGGSDDILSETPPINLRGSSLRNADLSGSRIIFSDLTMTNLGHSDLTGSFFLESNMQNASFHRCKLPKAEFVGCDLSGATFSSNDSREAQFQFCKLKGTQLYDDNIAEADFLQSRIWEAYLFESHETDSTNSVSFKLEEVGCINDLLEACREFRQTYGDDLVLYFRGENKVFSDLRPSVMRVPQEGEAALRLAEAEMLNDLMTRQPEAFNGLHSALAQWVLAQHHGLKTRLLDITRNPLVAVFNASQGPKDQDGRLHVFAVPRSLIKPFNSDTVRLITNFAKLPRAEQHVILGRQAQDIEEEDVPVPGNFLTFPYFFTKAKEHLYTAIRKESPYFEGGINVRDLFRVVVVEPQQSFERIRVQSGAFLVSAFHERFEEGEIRKKHPTVPLYSHHVLTVPKVRKLSLEDDLRLLNVTQEILFPSVDEAAEAITKQYGHRPNKLETSSEELRG